MDNIKWVQEKMKSLLVGKEVPVTLGVGKDNRLVVRNFSTVNTTLITGGLRAGKTSMLLYILKQITDVYTPKEVEVYLYDMQGENSILSKVGLEQVRGFYSTEADLLTKLEELTTDEVEKRTTLFLEGGHKNIIEYNKDNPQNSLPYIYVVIDEMQLLVDSLDKESNTKLKDALKDIVTKYSNYGLRLIASSFRADNRILDKAVVDAIPCRIAMKGEVADVYATLGDLTHSTSITRTGDMIVRYYNEVEYAQNNLG